MIAYQRVINLSHSIHARIPLWPGDPPVLTQTVANLAEDGYFLRQLTIGEHSGTHMNAPISFHTGGADIASYPPQSLVLPAVVVDVRQQAANDLDYLLTLQDAMAWEAEHGCIPAGSMVLLCTGWSQRWSDPDAFLGMDAEGHLHFPGFSPHVTEFLLTERKVAGVGTDTHGVDGGQDTDLPVNRRMLQAPRVVLENLTNLEQLPPQGATLVVGILRLVGGAGSPASVLAFVS